MIPLSRHHLVAERVKGGFDPGLIGVEMILKV
jgi:hypothetical protein